MGEPTRPLATASASPLCARDVAGDPVGWFDELRVDLRQVEAEREPVTTCGRSVWRGDRWRAWSAHVVNELVPKAVAVNATTLARLSPSEGRSAATTARKTWRGELMSSRRLGARPRIGLGARPGIQGRHRRLHVAAQALEEQVLHVGVDDKSQGRCVTLPVVEQQGGELRGSPRPAATSLASAT